MALFHFIKGLTPDEIKVVSECFNLNLDAPEKLKSKADQFLSVALATPLQDLNDDFMQRALGPGTSQAYRKLKSTVLYRILDKICSDQFIFNDNILSGTERVEVRIKKKLLQIKILYMKSAKADQKLFIQLLDEVIQESKEYELFDNLVEALSVKKYHFSVREGYSAFMKYNEEIDLYRACSAAKSLAGDFYFQIVSNQRLISHLSAKEIKNLIDEKVKLLEASPYTTMSTYIQYYYKVLKLAQYQQEKKNVESVDVCLDIINLLRRSKAIARNERFGFVYGNLSQCLTFQREFKQAAQTARLAEMYFPYESRSYVITAEQEFIACFYGKDYKRCNELLELMFAYSKRTTGKIREDIFTYYQGCLEFAKGNYKEARKIANRSLSIMKDKPRWDLGIRYLKIMSLIQLGEYEEARDAIEALRKQMARVANDDNREIAMRDNYIFRAFHEYSLNDFNQNSTSLQYILKKLREKTSSSSWNFYTHEVIPVHRWLLKRVTDAPLIDKKQERKRKKLNQIFS